MILSIIDTVAIAVLYIAVGVPYVKAKLKTKSKQQLSTFVGQIETNVKKDLSKLPDAIKYPKVK